jgi:hypothetical protein
MPQPGDAAGNSSIDGRGMTPAGLARDATNNHRARGRNASPKPCFAAPATTASPQAFDTVVAGTAPRPPIRSLGSRGNALGGVRGGALRKTPRGTTFVSF